MSIGQSSISLLSYEPENANGVVFFLTVILINHGLLTPQIYPLRELNLEFVAPVAPKVDCTFFFLGSLDWTYLTTCKIKFGLL